MGAARGGGAASEAGGRAGGRAAHAGVHPASWPSGRRCPVDQACPPPASHLCTSMHACAPSLTSRQRSTYASACPVFPRRSWCCARYRCTLHKGSRKSMARQGIRDEAPCFPGSGALPQVQVHPAQQRRRAGSAEQSPARPPHRTSPQRRQEGESPACNPLGKANHSPGRSLLVSPPAHHTSACGAGFCSLPSSPSSGGSTPQPSRLPARRSKSCPSSAALLLLRYSGFRSAARPWVQGG